MMKRGKWVRCGLWSVVCGLLAVTPAWADEPSDAAMRADIEVLKAKLSRLEAQMHSAPSGGVSGIGEKPAGALVELPSGLQGLGMSGFVDTSFSYNFAEPAPTVSRGNRGRVFDTEPEGFTIHVAEVVLEKSATDEMPLGFRADLFFGDDAEVIHSTGLGNGGSPSDSFDLQQAYITGKIPVGEGIDLKVGKFVTLLGAEVIESPANWNFSRSYLFGFAIPFTHTGALLTYPLGELGSVTAGAVNGWDVADDNNKGKSLLGNITLIPMEGLTLATNVITGAERSGHNRSVVDLVATWQATEQLALMANYDYGHESNLTQGASGVAGYDGANWQGLALYAKYDVTPTWALASRWEWFDDKDNVRLGFTGPTGGTLDDIDYREVTLTSQWKLREHVLARLEYRHDKASERVFFRDSDGFTNKHDTVAAELIYHF